MRTRFVARISPLLLVAALSNCRGETAAEANGAQAHDSGSSHDTTAGTGGSTHQVQSTNAEVGGVAGATSVEGLGGAPIVGGSTAVEVGSGGGDAGRSVRACKNTSASAGNGACRSNSDCNWGSWYKCCTTASALDVACWGPGACPLPPSDCQYYGNRIECVKDADCPDAGTCTTGISGCPQCPWSQCQYLPPKCTQNPDSCGTDARCQPDGGCAPLACDAGYACAQGSRCSVASARADGHGCELIACDDGWTCDENTRCTAPTDKSSHGCTVMLCSVDGDCDCGYCVNGRCNANLGNCTPAPS